MARAIECPHCHKHAFVEFENVEICHSVDGPGQWVAQFFLCPACRKLVIRALRGDITKSQGEIVRVDAYEVRQVEPLQSSRTAPPPSVSEPVRRDYIEACAVLTDSPKASAALSRRCLQAVLREKGGVKPGDLAKEIDQVLATGHLPTYIATAIDAIRNIGNMAAHPSKSTHTGEIVEVEAGEAEWNLDVLELLFDFYYVQPALAQEKVDALNKKLAGIGKPPIKKP